MKKPKVIKRNRTFQKNSLSYTYILFSAIFISGLVIGCSAVKRADSGIVEALSDLLCKIMRTDINNGFFKCLTSSLIAAVVFPLLSLLSGLCAFGAPISLLLPFMIGGICGITSASFYFTYNMKGLGFCTLIMFPFFAIVSATLIRCCIESLTMSMELFSYLTVNKNNSGKPALKEFCAKYAILLVPLAAAAIIRAIGFQLFAEMFNFI